MPANPVHPRARDYASSFLPGVIPHEAELTAGVRIEPGKRYGFFTDTTLCIGCKACEVACKEWNLLPADDLKLRGHSYDNTGDLGAMTWRHVHFIEQISPPHYETLSPAGGEGRGRGGGGVGGGGERRRWRTRHRNAAFPEQLADDERCLQALLAGAVPRSLPDRGAVPHRVRHRRRAAGHLQRLRLLPAGLPVRRRRGRARRRQGAQMHAVL